MCKVKVRPQGKTLNVLKVKKSLKHTWFRTLRRFQNCPQLSVFVQITREKREKLFHLISNQTAVSDFHKNTAAQPEKVWKKTYFWSKISGNLKNSPGIELRNDFDSAHRIQFWSKLDGRSSAHYFIEFGIVLLLRIFEKSARKTQTQRGDWWFWAEITNIG